MSNLAIFPEGMQPVVRTDLVGMIDAKHEEFAGKPRGHLGASILGRECSRALWYAFRWVKPENFPGRMLRLFSRGHQEEDRFVADLRRIGCEVHTVDPVTGKQFNWSALAGHSGGSQDGAARCVPGCPPERWYLLEFKTHNADSFSKLQKIGVRAAKPEHYDQGTLYMGWSGLRHCLYGAVNKDTDELYYEEFEFDEARFNELMGRAERIIFSDEPLPKLSSDPAFFKCKFCAARPVCHGKAMPEVNCRTCAHVTPTRDGKTDGVWTCARRNNAPLSTGEQRVGCSDHVFNPHLLNNHGTYVGGDAATNFAEYQRADGYRFRNGTRSGTVLSSEELSGIDPAALSDEWMRLRGPDAKLVALESLA